MVSGWHIDATIPSSQVERAVVDRTELLGCIIKHLRTFQPGAVESGRLALPRVDRHAWNVDAREFTVALASVRGAPSPHTVTVGVRCCDPVEIQPRCSACAHVDDGRCEHIYAALYHLYSEISVSDEAFAIASDSDTDESRGSWLSRLDRLDRFLASDRFAGARERGRRGAHRVCWRIEIHPGETLDLEIAPFEQRRDATDAWTKGRRVTWQRLASSPELWSTAADEAVVALLRSRSAAGDTPRAGGGPDPFDVLDHLVGHPHVALARDADRTLDVVRGTLALSLRLRDAGRLGLVPTLDGVALDRSRPWRVYARGLVAVDADADVVIVAAADPSRLSLIEHLLEERPTFPSEARGEVMSRLPAIEAILPIDIPAELGSRRVAADERPHVLLTPLGAGLSVSVRMRPLPGGTSWPPGEGPEVYGRLIDDEWVSAQRRPSREKKVARRTIDRVVAAARERHGDDAAIAAELEVGDAEDLGWTWEIRDADLAMAFLAALQSGVAGDVVVEWPEEGDRRALAEKLGLGALRVQISDRRDLFGLDGFVEIDGTRVALALLLDRVRQGRRWVQVGDDRWGEISAELRARLAAVADVSQSSGSGVPEIGATALPLVEESLGGCEVERSEKWDRLRTRFDLSETIETDIPTELHAELRPYQEDGYRWMCRLAHWGVGSCLADDMGLGKTVQTLAVLLHRRDDGPTLVVAPTSVTGNWIREARRFAPTLRPILYRETDRSSDLRRFAAGDLIVASYGLMRRDIEKLDLVSWGTVVLDEAQHVKNSRSQTSQAIRRLRAGWRLALTGTPIENHLGELWSLFRFLSPGTFGGWESFKRDYAEPIEKDGDDQRRQALARLTRPFILRRTKAEVLEELPPRTDVRLVATLSPAERGLYEDARLATLAYLSEKDVKRHKDVRFEVLAALTRLRQLACHPRMVHPELDIRGAKTNVFIETVETLREEGHRALVFSQFTRHLRLLRDELDQRGISYQYLDGQTPAKERDRLVDAFQSGEGDVFLISLMAGGTGLNLTAADYVIHMDPWWNPAVEDQATDRAHRMGQKRPVTVYRIVAEGTIEEEICKMQADKRDLISAVLEGADRAARLSTEELVGLLTRTADRNDANVESSA